MDADACSVPRTSLSVHARQLVARPQALQVSVVNGNWARNAGNELGFYRCGPLSCQQIVKPARSSLTILMRSENAEMTLRDYARVVDRRKWVVILAVLLATITALALTALQTPIYSTSSEVLVQPRGQDGLFENQVVNLNDRAIQTEIQVIEGQAVQQRVQDDLGLTERAARGQRERRRRHRRHLDHGPRRQRRQRCDPRRRVRRRLHRRSAGAGRRRTALGERRSADRDRRTPGRDRRAGRGRPSPHWARRSAVQLQHDARPAASGRRAPHRWRRGHQVGRGARPRRSSPLRPARPSSPPSSAC